MVRDTRRFVESRINDIRKDVRNERATSATRG